jgi:NADH-quinone oxidoreductase subunit B
MGLEDTLQPLFLLTRADKFIKWAQKNSLWPMPFGTACCAIEMMATYASRFDLARFGAERLSFSPRQADLMIVGGRVALKEMKVLIRIWEQMPEPKWCIAMGACASSGGIFDTYTLIQGVDQFIPVDVYVPVCPPRPATLIDGFRQIQKLVEEGKHSPTAFDRLAHKRGEAALEASRKAALASRPPVETVTAAKYVKKW